MRQCEVFIHNIKAGVLIEEDTPLRYLFIYDTLYLDEPQNPPVCLAMPLRKEAYVSKHLFPFFSNLLSEGENRMMQSSLLHIDKDDDFGILLATARYDTVGAVTVAPCNNSKS